MRRDGNAFGSAFGVFTAVCARADPMLDDFDYPYPVKTYEFTSQRQPLSMAYMDVRADGRSQRQDGRAPARQELLRRRRGRARSRLSLQPGIGSWCRIRSASASRRSPRPIR